MHETTLGRQGADLISKRLMSAFDALCYLDGAEVGGGRQEAERPFAEAVEPD